MENTMTKNSFEKQDTKVLLAEMRQRVKLLEAMLLKLNGENINTDKPIKTEAASSNTSDLNVAFDDSGTCMIKK